MTMICFALSQQSQTDDQVKAKRISDRVIIYNYMNVNVTAINSKNGIIIIDTHRSPSTMNTIKKSIEKDFGKKDFLFVINTHGDYDHASGNQVFPNATIIGHENCPEFMRNAPANSPQSIWYLNSILHKMNETIKKPTVNIQDKKKLQMDIEVWNKMLESVANEYKVTPPNKTFSNSLIMNLDNLTVKMIYCGNAHTDNDIFIYLPEEKIVFTGDIFTSKNSYGFTINRMNDIERVISSMDQILVDPAGVEVVIPGHGKCLSGNDFISLRNHLKEETVHLYKTLSTAQLIESMIKRNGIHQALKKYSEMTTKGKNKYYNKEEEFSILGNRYLRKGMLEEAIGVFNLYSEIFPNSALVYDYLGEAYMKKGKIDSAIVNYKKSLKIFPENKNAIEILKMLGDTVQIK